MRPWLDVRTSGSNGKYREHFVRNWMNSLNPNGEEIFLDIGAGNMPYKSFVTNIGFTYISHDFGQYTGDVKFPGPQSENWPTSGHDITCEILDLPADTADVFLCTEVLEHVPNPVTALEAIARSLKDGGVGLITVPFQSRMHQAPYWFSSGLSPYWFIYHAPRVGLTITQMTKVGDFVDVMIQEIGVLFSNVGLQSPCVAFLRIISPVLRALVKKSVLESGALGVYVELKKSNESVS